MNPWPPETNPFNLEDDASYERWCEWKLAGYPESLNQLTVEIGDLNRLTAAEHEAIIQRIDKTGMAIYQGKNGDPGDKETIRRLGAQFGLGWLDRNLCADEDAISSIETRPDAGVGYIPYSDRPIAWHTDGYYNTLDRQIFSMLLHCVRPAEEGGANELLDQEILYIQLRDRNPDYIHALMHPQAMTIPANIVDDRELRPERSGPVFLVRPDGRLHMRYTDRNRSIQWRDDPVTREAVMELKQFLQTNSRYHFQGTLQPGQGLICNNVLHTRSHFRDGAEGRLLFRARYFDAIPPGQKGPQG
jgi:hypothetical protein